MREIITGRIGTDITYEERKNSKTGEIFNVAEFKMYVGDPYSKKDEKGSWPSVIKTVKAAGPFVDQIKELEEKGELGKGNTISVLGVFRVSHFEKDGQEKWYEYLSPEKIDTTLQLEKEHNHLLRAFAKGEIDSLTKGMEGDEFPSIEKADELEKSLENQFDIETSVEMVPEVQNEVENGMNM